MTASLHVTSVAIFIILITDTCAFFKEEDLEMLMVFNSDTDIPLTNFLASQYQSDFSLYSVGSKFKYSDYELLHMKKENYEGPGYMATQWHQRPPKSIVITVRTFENNAEGKHFISQKLHQHFYRISDESPTTWFAESLATDRKGLPIKLIRFIRNDLVMLGISGRSMISAHLIVDNATKNFILASKMQVSPDYSVFGDDTTGPTSEFYNKLERTKLLRQFVVAGNLTVQMDGRPCIRSILVESLQSQIFWPSIVVDILMYIAIDAPNVLWIVTLNSTGERGHYLPSAIKFDSVVCPANITINVPTGSVSEGTPEVTVSLREVEADYNIGKFITVHGYYKDIEDTNGNVAQIEVDENIPILNSQEESETELPSFDQTSESSFQENLATSKQPLPNQTSPQEVLQEQTSISQISTSQTSTSQRYTTRITPVTTGETKINSTLKCYEDSSRSWNTQINSSVLQALQAEVVELKQRLAVNKSSLSSSIRRKNSAPDMRISSQIMGIVGGAILALIFGGLVIIDLPTIAQALKLMKRNVMGN